MIRFTKKMEGIRIRSFHLINGVCALSLPVFVTGQEVDREWWFVNGSIQSMVQAGDTLFVGGSFDHICPPWSHGAVLDTALGQVFDPGVFPNGSVLCAIPAAEGGWYIGGSFDRFGTEERGHLARIDHDGALLPWNPTADYAVLCMELVGDTLYVGGTFTTINGQARNRIAAFSTTTGALLPPVGCTSMTGAVVGMSESDGLLYFGGTFTSVCGQVRSRLAAIDIADHALADWAPVASVGQYTGVNEVKAYGNRIYVGGQIDSINGVPRGNAAVLDTTGALLPWDPMVSGTVYCMELLGDRLWIGGGIDSIGGSLRRGIGVVDTVAGNLLPWQPDWQPASTFVVVKDMDFAGSKLYLGGAMELVGGRNDAVCLDVGTGELLSWNPNADYDLVEVCMNGDRIYCGGWFRSIGRIARHNGAAFSISTKEPLAWDPRTTPEFADLWGLAVIGDLVYLGGSFTGAGGDTSVHLAGVDRITGDLVVAANANSYVNALTAHDGLLYAGGIFTNINGQFAPFLAVLSPLLDSLYAWDHAPDWSVSTLKFEGDTLFVGGWFEQIGQQLRSRAAAIDVGDDLLLPWAPEADDVVRSFCKRGDLVYLGGDFMTIDQQPRTRLAAVDLATGAALPWAPAVNDGVNSIALYGDRVYATGSFYNGNIMDPASFLAAWSMADGSLIPWAPQFTSLYWGLTNLVIGDELFVGGNFHNLEVTPREGLVVYHLPPIDVGMEPLAAESDLVIWPVPAGDQLYFNEPVTGEIVDAAGRFVLQVRNKSTIDVRMLDPGLYSIHRSGERAVRFVVN